MRAEVYHIPDADLPEEQQNLAEVKPPVFLGYVEVVATEEHVDGFTDEWFKLVSDAGVSQGKVRIACSFEMEVCFVFSCNSFFCLCLCSVIIRRRVSDWTLFWRGFVGCAGIVQKLSSLTLHCRIACIVSIFAVCWWWVGRKNVHAKTNYTVLTEVCMMLCAVSRSTPTGLGPICPALQATGEHEFCSQMLD